MSGNSFDFLSGGGMATPSVTSAPSATNTTQIAFTRDSLKYDSPFLDMTSTFLPTRIKDVLRFSAAYCIGDSLVSQCVSKLSEYPITSIIYELPKESRGGLPETNLVSFWKELLEKKVDILRVLKQSGMDYYTYGNSIVSINYPFNRMLTCPKCQTQKTIKVFKDVEFKNFEFEAECPNDNCKFRGKGFIASDVTIMDMSKVRVVHWDLSRIEIKYNSITGDHFYYYTVSSDIADALRRGDMDIVNTTRMEIIKASQQKKPIKLLSDNIFHLKRPAPQYLIPSERGWGIPVVMAVMKDIFHTRILKKGNEMIAFDHIAPLRILFPQGNGEISPHAGIDLGGWKTQVELEINKWRKDPNYISVMPIPLGMQNLSGDLKMLNVISEIKQIEDDVIIGMGVIPEIVRGGASWSGSNVSLRVVENTFLNHRESISRLLEFIVDRLSVLFQKPKIDVHMSDFKMADDMQRKSMVINASSGSVADSLLSKETAIKELGFDPTTEMEAKHRELKKIIELGIEEQEGMAEAQGAASIVNAMYRADSEINYGKKMDKNEQELAAEQDLMRRNEKSQNAYGIQEEVQQQFGNQNVSLPVLVMAITKRFVALANTNPEEFKLRMLIMKNSMPSMYNEVSKNLKEANLIKADLIPDMDAVNKYTPGQIPSNSQGDVKAGDPPSPVESGMDVAEMQKSVVAVPVSKPENPVRPPRWN
jgi:hypothetical protein